MSEMRQQISLMDKRVVEMKDHVVNLEQECNKTVLQAANFANVVRMSNSTPNILRTHSSAECLQNLEYPAKFFYFQLKKYCATVTTKPPVIFS